MRRFESCRGRIWFSQRDHARCQHLRSSCGHPHDPPAGWLLRWAGVRSGRGSPSRRSGRLAARLVPHSFSRGDRRRPGRSRAADQWRRRAHEQEIDDGVRAREAPAPADRRNLQADCGSCFGLCCVALPFAASADFAIDKDAGQPCPNLRTDFRCGIHTDLRHEGFSGCTVFDCFGAGQKVSQVTFGGRDWRQAPGTARQMFDVFPVMRQLHELLWYLTEALTLPAARPVHADLRRALDETERPHPRQRPGAHASSTSAAHRRRGQRAAAAHQRTRAGRGRRAARRTAGAPTSSGPSSRAPTCGAPTCAGPTSSPPTSRAPTCARPT